MTNTTALSQQQYNLLNYIEQIYLLEGYVPDKGACVAYVKCSPAYYDQQMKNELFLKKLSDRGIPTAQVALDIKQGGALTEEQLACVNTLLDFSDRRSRTKKLADLGINSQKYQAWLRDPAFQYYIRQRSENLLPDAMHEVHGALLDTAARGDTSAMKLYYEMTGRYSTKSASEVNVEFLMMKIVEVVTKYVTDPVALEAIANELSVLSNPKPIAANPLAILEDRRVVDL